MRYVRLEENAMEHPKFIAISDKAFRLWCEGCAYCQKSLTDGRIPAKAVKGFRYRTAAALRELLTENAPGKGPLWHRDGGDVFIVHDYLDWNESRDRVLANRKAGKDRLDRYRKEQAVKRGVTLPHETRSETPHETARDVPSKRNGTEQNDLPERSPGDTRTVPEDPKAQIAWLQERYADLHLQIIGVGYIGNPQADYREWCGLLPVFGVEMLEKLMVYWFHTDDEFTRKGTRTVAKLRSRASKYAEELKAKKLA